MTDQTMNWRSFYADKMNTDPDKVFYSWELSRKLKASANRHFGDVIGSVFNHAFHVKIEDIAWVDNCTPLDPQDDTEEIPF